jgi:hypothetical protein
MNTWQASIARTKFADIFDGAMAGQPQYVVHRDGREVVVVSKQYFEDTRPNVKTFLLKSGYEGEGEAEFDDIMQGVRGSTSGMFAVRRVDTEGK